MTDLKLLLLGTPALQRDGAPVVLETRKALALLAYLSVTGRAHSREALAGLLWPDYESARAFANLRRTLWALSKAGVAQLVEAEAENVALNPAAPLWSDIVHFQRQLADCRAHGHPEGEPCARCLPNLTQAAEAYRGDFLSGFSLRDAPAFDEWQFFQAESLRRDLAGVLERLARLRGQRGDFAPAIADARRWLSLDPLNEAAHRRLMELYSASGQRGAALRQYQEAARVLEAELGAPPQPETTALYEHIQVGERRVPAAGPPRHNLPAQLSSFVGREREREAVRRLLSTARLVTLTGAGGSGKTRLALHVAGELLDTYPDGVWLAELTTLSAPAMVLPKVAALCGVPEAGAGSLEARLMDYLRDRHLLLLLDNCEHLIDASAQLAERLLSAASRLTVLATSREPLGLMGESVFRVPSLSLPAAGETQLEALAGSESGQLFAARAAAVQPGFVLTAANAPAVAQICQRLDGIPLALELAAARVRAMPPEQIAERLDDRFRLLTGGSRTALPRQQTLRALIDWSWDLLQEPERALLRRVAVFVGGWTLEAAESVGPSEREGLARADILDILTRLVDKSLVIMDEQGSAARYRLLETVRQYARDRLLDATPGETETLRDRHLAYFAAFAEAALPGLHSQDQAAWLDRLEAEHGNFRVALDWSLGRDAAAAQTGLRLAGALGQFWAIRCHWTEGRDYGDRLLSRPENFALGLARAKALNGAAFLEYSLGDLAASERHYAEAVDIWRSAGPSALLADALRNFGNVLTFRGNAGAGQPLLQESLAMSRVLGEDEGTAWTLLDLGTHANNRNDLEVGRAFWLESLALHRRLGNQQGIAILLSVIGQQAMRQGDLNSVRAIFDESLALSRTLGDRRGIAVALGNLGRLAMLRGDLATAEALLEESLPLWRDLGVNAMESLLTLGMVRDARGDLDGARDVIERGARLAQESGSAWQLGYARFSQAQLLCHQGRLAQAWPILEECVAIARDLNQYQSLPDALSLQGWAAARLGQTQQAMALLRESLARYQETHRKWESVGGVERLAALEPDAAQAARLLGAAEAQREVLGTPRAPVDKADYAQMVAGLRGHLAAADFERAWAEGRAQGAVDWEQVVAGVLG